MGSATPVLLKHRTWCLSRTVKCTKQAICAIALKVTMHSAESCECCLQADSSVASLQQGLLTMRLSDVPKAAPPAAAAGNVAPASARPSASADEQQPPLPESPPPPLPPDTPLGASLLQIQAVSLQDHIPVHMTTRHASRMATSISRYVPCDDIIGRDLIAR